MGNLREYSGLTTKIKAMRSRLISEEEYRQLMELDTVAAIAEYLKNRRGFETVLGDADMSDIHRETVEYAIIYSVYNDYRKLYKFANMRQRKYLKLHFARYEVRMIKRAIRRTSVEYMTSEQGSLLSEVFGKYSGVRLEKLQQASNIGEIVDALSGTMYYEPLKPVRDSGSTNPFDYEMTLDIFLFRYMWKKRRNEFSGSELKAITDTIASEAEFLNIAWIYRAKRFFNMTRSEIAAMIIPIYRRVKKQELLGLIEADDLEELKDGMRRTAYGRYFTPDTFNNMELDRVCKGQVDRVFEKYYRLEPYSVAAMSSYLRDKKRETERLIKIVECVRYGYPKDEIFKEII